MSSWGILAIGMAVWAFGVWCYRSGRTAAENAALRKQEQENEAVDKAISANAALGRDALLDKLRGNAPE